MKTISVEECRPVIQRLQRLDSLTAKQLISRWQPGDSVVIEVSAQEFAEGIQEYLPHLARWTYEGLYKDEGSIELMPQFIYLDDNAIEIYTARFSYQEIKEGRDDGQTKAIFVAPWPDVLPNNLETHLPISGGTTYQRKYSLLTRVEINTQKSRN